MERRGGGAGPFDDGKLIPLHFQRGNVEEEHESLPLLMACTLLFKTWWTEAAWPGMGLFGESYLLFSIGLIKPFWKILYPDCFSYNSCSPQILNSLTYSAVLGVIFGMGFIGLAANRMGRRMGGIMTASFMSAGAIGLTSITFFFANDARTLFLSMSVLLFVFGFGVGGEYPMSSATATEKAMGDMRQKLKREIDREAATKSGSGGLRDDASRHPMYHVEVGGESEDLVEQSRKIKRGQAVQLVFMSQGTGILMNSLSLVLLLVVFRQYGSDVADGDYSSSALFAIWRIVYSIGALVLTFVLVTRIMYLQESSVWSDDKDQRERLNRTAPSDVDVGSLDAPEPLTPTVSNVSSLSTPSSVMLGDILSYPGLREISKEDLIATPLQLLFRHYGCRIFGTSMAWLLWDVSFYGNKLFQSTFLLAITGEQTTLLELSGAAALNAFVALLGYIGAAFFLDHPKAGRLRLQQYGLLAIGILFVGCGCLYDKIPSGWLVLMYFASSFIGQLGPNATTFLIPAEIFPTEMRTLCHGIAAASGKVGALIAAVAFNYVRDVDMFFLSGYASFAACVVTFWTVPDVTRLDLYELDRQWRKTLEGRRSEYIGDANKPEFLSYYERSKLGLNY